MRRRLDIEWEWDGKSSTASLCIEGRHILTGSPPDVEAVFDILNAEQGYALALRARLDVIRNAIARDEDLL